MAVFINRCKYSKPYLLEATRAATATRYTIVCAFLVVAFLGVAVFNCYFLEDYASALTPFLAALFFASFYWVYPYIIANRSYKQQLEIHHKELETEISFFDDSIQCLNEQTKGETRIEYPQII